MLNVVYFTDEKCKIFDCTIYNKISRYCQTNAKIESYC